MKKPHIHIAICDDHALFCDGLKLIINSRPDFDLVFEAHNGQELLDGISKLKTPPDVVLLDLKMPVKDGIETTRELRVAYPRLSILILTMLDQDDYILHLLDLGANGYLLKNSSAQEVLEAIENVVQKGFYFSDHVSQVMLEGLKRKRTPPTSFNAANKFSSRELEVCDLMKEGLTTQEIADRLFISNRTVETHRKNLMEKFGVKNSAGVIYRALKEGLLK
jgi:DNA-binding NarL/FixJ family response regulator